MKGLFHVTPLISILYPADYG